MLVKGPNDNNKSLNDSKDENEDYNNSSFNMLSLPESEAELDVNLF